MCAAKGGHLHVVKLLLENGADANAQSENGEMALKMAREQGRTEIMELLKAHGAME
jgi:ankyrin repeat protein